MVRAIPLVNPPTLRSEPAPPPPSAILSWDLQLPDWRYQAALKLARLGRAPLDGAVDPSTRAMARLLNHEALHRSPRERWRLRDRWPELSGALAISREPDRATAALLEALMLARELPAIASRDAGVPVTIVEAYANLFFAIGDRINHPLYILHHVIAPELRRGAPEVARRNATIKFVAYFSGSAGLRDLYFASRAAPLELWRSLPEMAKRVELTRDIEALVAAALPGVPDADDAPRLEALVARVRASANHSVPPFPPFGPR